MRQPVQSAFGAINATSLLNWSFELRPEDLWQELTPVAISIDPEHCGYQHLQYPRGPERNNREHRRENPPRGKAAQREPLGSLGGHWAAPLQRVMFMVGTPPPYVQTLVENTNLFCFFKGLGAKGKVENASGHIKCNPVSPSDASCYVFKFGGTSFFTAYI